MKLEIIPLGGAMAGMWPSIGSTSGGASVMSSGTDVMFAYDTILVRLVQAQRFRQKPLV
jgi:hypothetical protein